MYVSQRVIRISVLHVVKVVRLVLEPRRKRAHLLTQLGVVELTVVDDLAFAIVRTHDTII